MSNEKKNKVEKLEKGLKWYSDSGDGKFFPYSAPTTVLPSHRAEQDLLVMIIIPRDISNSSESPCIHMIQI